MKLNTEQEKGKDGTCATVYIQGDKSKGNSTGLVRVNAHDVPEGAEVVDAKKAAKLLGAAEKGEEESGEDFAEYNVKQLKAHLDKKGVAYEKDALKDVLIALCVENP